MFSLHRLLTLAGILREATVTDKLRAMTFYHGTSDDEVGHSVLHSGIVPGNVTGRSRGHLTPVSGRSYLTPILRYGVIYCIGGNMLGSSHVEHLINKNGRTGRASRYGWLFVIDGDRLVGDIQPDEDSVGEAAMYANIILNVPEQSHYYQSEPLFQGLLQADRRWLRAFFYNARMSMTQRQWTEALDGYIAAQAAGGKRFLRRMTDWDKLALINAGAHISYQGALMPSQAWRFDKMLTPELESDGSNFFELADQVA